MLNETVLFEDQLYSWGHYLIEFVVVHCHPPGSTWFYKSKASESKGDMIRILRLSEGGSNLCHSPCDIYCFYLVGWGQGEAVPEFPFGLSHQGSSCPTGQRISEGLSAKYQVCLFQLYIYAFGTAGWSMKLGLQLLPWIQSDAHSDWGDMGRGQHDDNLGPCVSILIQTLCPWNVQEIFFPQCPGVNGAMSLWRKNLENPCHTCLLCVTGFFLLGLNPPFRQWVPSLSNGSDPETKQNMWIFYCGDCSQSLEDPAWICFDCIVWAICLLAVHPSFP